MIGAIVLGSPPREDRGVDWPVVTAAFTYSCVFSESTSPRTSLATGGQETTPIANTIEPELPGLQDRDHHDRQRETGDRLEDSVKRISASSTNPPASRSTAPSGTPISSATIVETSPYQRDPRAMDHARHHVAALHFRIYGLGKLRDKCLCS